MKTQLSIIALAAIGLTGCAGGPSAKSRVMDAPFFMSEEVTIERQRLANPSTVLLQWTKDDSLYRSLSLDYVAGLSNRSYLFEKANRVTYEPMLGYALNSANLLAPTNLSGRYGLQISFVEIDTDFIGLDYAGKSTADYRIVDRASGTVVYEKRIDSNFLAVYPRLNEDVVARAYDISAPLAGAFQKPGAAYLVGEGFLKELINNNNRLSDFFGGPFDEASQSTWNDVTQAYVWGTGLGLVAGPTIVALEQINPLNFVSLKFHGQDLASEQALVRNGPLSEWGLGARNGAERARQANAQLLAQSIAIFIADLAAQERIDIVHRLPCNRNADVEDAFMSLMAQGKKVVTDNCLSYTSRPDNRGLGLPTWK